MQTPPSPFPFSYFPSPPPLPKKEIKTILVVRTLVNCLHVHVTFFSFINQQIIFFKEDFATPRYTGTVPKS